jgi:tetrahydromethanopterin S-methyltransferase subunit G
MNMEKIPSWIERLLLPKLNAIEGELKAINTRIDSVDERMNTKMTGLDDKIDSLRNEMKSEFTGLNYRFEKVNERIDSLRTEVTVRLDSLENRIPVIEKIAVLELKIAEMEKRLAAA